MLHTVKKVEYCEGYKLRLTFDDKITKMVDFEERLKNAKNMFLPLQEISYFKKVKTDGTTLFWPNGLDLCPDVLYQTGKDVPEPKKASRSRSLHHTKTTPKKGPVKGKATHSVARKK